MANVYFGADWHWGHPNVCNFRKQFSSEEEHRLTIKENALSVVTKRDILWLLGDIIFDEACLKDLDDLPCKKFLVMGNHDAQRFDQRKLFNSVDKVFGITKKYGAWMSHAPIHPDELRGAFCVHGHTHEHLIDDPRYINACLEHHEYKPFDLNWLREEMRQREELIEETKNNV